VLILSALYALGMATVVVLGANQLVLAAWRIRSERLLPGPPPDPAGGSPPDARTWPRVTVQLPLYNERYVATRLIDAVAALDYPHDRLEVQVLDDSTDDTAPLAAARVARWRQQGLDITHVRRDGRDGYKAGALANGLTFASGDLVAVFDADFLPAPDFLRATVPHFADPSVGMVQARWAHTNEEDSPLTRAQAALLDAHFAVEQVARHEAGWCLSFNGTAGVWRRTCIEDAGGWEADTLTEDLDLSYRAQLAGWRFRFLPDLLVPADLPAEALGWRRQQFRWAKGTAEVARKLAARVARSRLPAGARLQGLLHLFNFAAYPAILLIALVHAPVLAAHASGAGPPDAFVAALGVGMVALAGMVLAHLLAQRATHADWRARLAGLPWWLLASMSLAPANTRGIVEALVGRRTPFERTPKGRYAVPLPALPVGAALLAAYALAGLAALVYTGAWIGVPFQALFVGAFCLAVRDAWVPRQSALRTLRAVPR
jgi:cellulose synthase/poly-beta-1,6-N-acetylglucosamine synthase-like glycosyltransferase